MTSRKTRAEFGRFSLVGITASAMDYVLLNILVGIFGLPVIGSNIASTTSSSYVSFMLNRKVVFKEQKYGTARSMMLYALTIGFGILILQSTVFHLLDNGKMIEDWIKPNVGNDTLAMFIGLNATKVLATSAAGLWNFTMLQRFVFVSHDDRKN